MNNDAEGRGLEAGSWPWQQHVTPSGLLEAGSLAAARPQGGPHECRRGRPLSGTS